ncbi:DUF3572 domain-containing protein [Roseovarius sp. MMSF_3281]|uniref:DUF3572 domain-containing protein n=1 Tax=Roseovarius sp. MMSF_3281 TaxID=3046694 RepID=UPI00273F74EC|nr:DUF3572 domain-containing protein [Roseovarius sp. MMSF_3281]
MNITRDSAETVALQCLAWLAGNEELLPVFMGATGVSEAELREQAQDPVFLGSVLDFLLMDDAWVIACSEAQGFDPQLPQQARAALPGGEQVNWT